MSFKIHVEGHDDLQDEAKEAFENGLVAYAKALVGEIKSGAGVTVSHAAVETDGHGNVDLTDLELAQEEQGSTDDAPAIPPDEAEAEESDASESEDTADSEAPAE